MRHESMMKMCPAHPGDGSHECMASEMRCALCGERLAPYPCHHCGKFLTAAQMARVCHGENPRCNELDDTAPAPGKGTAS